MVIALLALTGCPWIPTPEACDEAYYVDADADGFGDPDSGAPFCAGDPAAADLVSNGDDCDDADASVGERTWYSDEDGDAYGDATNSVVACINPAAGAYVTDATDCDDRDAETHPRAEESWYDGVDQDCDGNDGDQDGDGAIAVEAGGDDCLDTDPAAGPGAVEIWYDGVDQDCDGNDCDQDGDLSCIADYVSGIPAFYRSGDCDDLDPLYHPGADEFDCYDPNDYNCDGSVGLQDQDSDGYVACVECWDASGEAYPGAAEVCDGLDNDCEGTVDVDATDQAVTYEDADGDGYGDGGTGAYGCGIVDGEVLSGADCDDTHVDVHPGAEESCEDPTDYNCDGSTEFEDADSDGSPACEDCDDGDSGRRPDGTELCDGADNDCDGEIDEGALDADDAFTDADGDGYGDPSDPVLACEITEGLSLDSRDCDDTDAANYPDAEEFCDGVDNNCHGDVDEDGATGSSEFYADADADGFGDPDAPTSACSAPSGAVDNSDDCDPDSASIYPGAPEVCGGQDDDCDGLVDDADTLDGTAGTPWYTDLDGDSFGDPSVASISCEPASGEVSDDSDCDDADPDAFPGAVETCDLLDNDCDTLVDDDDDDVTGGSIWYADVDTDGYGDALTSLASCEVPDGFLADDSDCDDADADFNTDAVEICDGLDNDCDTLADDDDDDLDTATGSTYYADVDGDGYGDAESVSLRCADGEGWTAEGSDCDDANGAANPAAPEIAGDGVDQDCDGVDASSEDYSNTSYGSLMILVRGGTFTMGGGVADPSNAYLDHEVTLTRDFWIGQTEVTRDQWEAFADNVGWAYTSYPCTTSTATGDCPADSISWYDVAKYANALSTAEGLASCYLSDGADLAAEYVSDPYSCPGYRMPTEAEWEYAARAGEDTIYSGSDTAGDVAWTAENAYDLGTYSHEVATLGSNAWGLYDMSGNLYEWSVDGYDAYYGGYSTGAAATDPPGPSSPGERVLRGGRWRDTAASTAMMSYRNSHSAPDRFSTSGARLARTSLTPDGDADGDPAIADGGTDCADWESTIYDGATDTPDDGIDQDCDGADATLPEDYTTTYGSTMIAIPAGTFTMGGGAGDPDGWYLDHDVTLTRGFWLAETEITRDQWESFADNVGWAFTTGYPCTTSTTEADCPADSISWYDVAKYANALSAAEGFDLCYLADGTDLAATYLADPYSCPGYRMPTEAEREYAARADEDTRYAGSDTLDDVAWTYENAYSAGTYAHQVATLAPNAWGLYDMSGNLFEWTDDWYDAAYGGYSTGAAAADPPGASSGTYRVVRGGGWIGNASRASVSYRDCTDPSARDGGIGTRLARTIP